ncbi:hypothetical protein N0V93_006504 [Gnomoniopsis smithogilvyi]|uniref:Uncharacterized protein n=1 Tax=Gnomoniopsis smithogilvyi TaxID=1191159 RepID=A0A9W8YPT5_9PEZI|nr:hypothetical protein N0V93_006504 [Gnomoniopsis smithogilvyi]
MAPAKIVFVAGSFMSSISSAEQVQTNLGILKESGIEKIDTDHTYEDSEQRLGRAHASSDFAIDTKNPGGLSPDPFVLTKDGVLEIMRQSLARLQTDQVSGILTPRPSAGGFLAKTPEQLKARSSTRWDPSSFIGEMYHTLYANKESTLEALGSWHEIAAAEGISGIDMAYR